MEARPITLIILLVSLLGGMNEARATWCIAGNLNKGAITPTTTSQTTAGFNPSGKVPYWSFSATAGVSYYFDLCSSANTEDAVLNIYNGASPGGNLVAGNDEGNCASLSGLTFVCPSTGTYYVVANRYPANTFSTSGTLNLTYYVCGSVTPASTPISDTWTGISMTTACTSWMAQGAGSEGDWYINNAALGFAYGTQLAGGAGAEAILAGNQYNMYGIGVSKTPSLISYPINTNGTNSMVYSWKHTLQINGDNGISGSNTINIQLQSSNDLINWNTEWTGSYPVTGSATYGVFKTVQSVTINTGTNVTTWLRFYFNGVVGKIAYWAIDNGASGTIVLPVELTGLSAKQIEKSVKVNWSTQSENNNHFFTIERSADGETFAPVGKVIGAGYSTEAVQYEFEDKEPLPGVNYYRIAQTDYNGQMTRSSIVIVNLLENGQSMSDVYPNPASSGLSFNFFSGSEGIVELEVVDVNGKMVYATNSPVQEGFQTLGVDISNVARGIYSLCVKNTETGLRCTKRFVKN